ncbi:MAG: 4-(cytidine 5'-diphospho)-2-C-methyl-D-erythritol kinase [Filimonas sp.]|nr:4-(cytidine 5'-diphospho)-2-C-methyl-D-erythritol kinase [Filimonas sp.]
MVSFPNCKINLGLHITRKREDGYHDLETVFYPINLKDALEVVTTDGELAFTTSGLTIDGNADSNLCLKAYHLLKADFPQLPSVKMHLHKAIPMGAGMGGGSADGAFTLRLLNSKYNLGLTTEQLIQYALQLGSDCPFFIINKPAYATGRGEVLEEITLDLSAYTFVIVNPGIHVNTGWAFSQLTPTQPKQSIRDIIQQPVETWKDVLVNDFEAAVIKRHPAIGDIKELLYNNGALYASMTGSGSTVFGLFPKAQPIAFAIPWTHWVV